MLPTFANALSLEDAKAQGLVGEESNGYLGAVQGRPDVETLVQSVNNQRKQKYADIAKKNGTTLVAVEVLAGKKAVENTAPGQYIRTGSGWSQK
ncbi:MAG: YdbL family protein [Deltaproteobacteria bacterium]|nr:YdbL family protein [Deltaproteobacteria bacterium]